MADEPCHRANNPVAWNHLPGDCVTSTRHVLLLALMALSCAPSIPHDPDRATSDTPDSPPDDEPGPSDTDADTGNDSGDDSDDDTGVETLPPTRAQPVLDPPPQLFVDSLTVSLSSDEGQGDVKACVGTPDTACTPTAASTITLTESGVIYARVDFDSSEGKLTETPYVKVSADVAAFTSNLPVLVAWSDRAVDDMWTNTPMVLLSFDQPTDRTELTAPAELASRCRLRIRGSSSAGLSKKNYDLELWEGATNDDGPQSMLGLPEDADWVLHGPNYYDDALVRNALGYQLSHDIGRYAPRTVFAEMFLLTQARTLTLDNYMGVYVVTEEIERGGDRVDVSRLEEGDIAHPEVTGGYVFKRDREGASGEGIYVGSGGGAFEFWDPIVPVDPEQYDLERQQLTYLSDELDALGFALAADDGLDPSSGRHWNEILDIDSFIDHHILAVVVKNPDAFRLSGYFHKDREGPIMAGPIWDLDRTAGSIDWRATDPYHWDATNITTDTTAVFSYGWYGPLFDDPDFRARYWARWQTLLAGPLAPAAVQAHIDSMRAELSEAGPRNSSRWSTPPWSGEVDNMAGWYAARLGWVAACIDAHDDPRVCAGAF